LLGRVGELLQVQRNFEAEHEVKALRAEVRFEERRGATRDH
jgi:hypothetical protein